MKTTIDIPYNLLQKIKELAVTEQTTVKALVSEGLQSVLTERLQNKPFKLRKVTFRGQGLQPELKGILCPRA